MITKNNIGQMQLKKLTMAYEYKLPSLGDGVTGKVLDILVKPGDTVAKDQVVLIVGTDKVDAEMPVDADGVVVIERAKAAAMMPLAVRKVADEAARIEAIARGDTASAWLPAALRAAGMLKEGEVL